MNTSELIKEHTKFINESQKKANFLEVHLRALETLKHERLIHLIITMFVTLFCLIFLGFYLFFNLFPLLLVFVILLILIGFYFFYYYELENTVIKWQEIEYSTIVNKEDNLGK